MGLIGGVDLNPYREIGEDIERLIRLDKASNSASPDLTKVTDLYVSAVSKIYMDILSKVIMD